MQNAPMASSSGHSSSTDRVTLVFDRIPSSCTPGSAARNSSSSSAPLTLDTSIPRSLSKRSASGWMFSSSRAFMVSSWSGRYVGKCSDHSRKGSPLPADISVERNLVTCLGRGVAGVHDHCSGKGLVSPMVGVVPCPDLLEEVQYASLMQSIAWDCGLQRGRDPLLLGPDVKCAVWIAWRAPLHARAAVGAVDGHIAVILGNPLSPAGLQQQSAAPIEPEKRGGQVLDVELALLDPRLSHGRLSGASASPGSELRIRCRGGRSYPGLAK